MKESSEKAVEINGELSLYVDEEQNDKTFKVKSYIDNLDEVQEITATRTPMKQKVCEPISRECTSKNEVEKLHE